MADVFEKLGNPDDEKARDVFEALGNPDADMENKKSGKSSFSNDRRTVSERLRDTGNQYKDFGLGLAEDTANLLPGTVNALTWPLRRGVGLDIGTLPRFNFAPHSTAAELGRTAAWFTPGLALKGLGKIEGLSNLAKEAMSAPQVAALAKKAQNVFSKYPTATNIAKNALLGGALADDENTGTGLAIGAGGASLGHIINSLSRLPPGVGSNLLRTGIGAGMGALAAPALGMSPLAGAGFGGGAMAGAPKMLKALGVIEENPGLETLSHLNQQEVQPVIEAGKRIGTPLTPGEASGNPYVASQEGQFSRSGASAAHRTNIEKARLQQQEKSINDFLGKVYSKDEGADKAIKGAYEHAYSHEIPKETMDVFKNNDFISHAIDKVESTPEYREVLKGVSDNSVLKGDLVKRAMDDIISGHLEAGRKNQARLATEIKDQFVNALDEASNGTYKTARDLAQPKIIREQIEKKLGTGALTGANFYKKILANNNKYKELSADLKNSPEARAHLADMKLAWENLLDMAKPKTSAMMARTSTSAPRELIAKIYDMMRDIGGQKNNIKALDFIHGGEWDKEFAKVAAQKNASLKSNMLADLISRIFSIKGNK